MTPLARQPRCSRSSPPSRRSPAAVTTSSSAHARGRDRHLRRPLLGLGADDAARRRGRLPRRGLLDARTAARPGTRARPAPRSCSTRSRWPTARTAGPSASSARSCAPTTAARPGSCSRTSRSTRARISSACRRSTRRRAWAVGEWGTRIVTDDGGASWQDHSLTIDHDAPACSSGSRSQDQERVRNGEKVYEDVGLNDVFCLPAAEPAAAGSIGEFGYIFCSDDRRRRPGSAARSSATSRMDPIVLRYNVIEIERRRRRAARRIRQADRRRRRT